MLHKDLLWKGMGCFSIGFYRSNTLEKTGFRQNGILEKYNHFLAKKNIFLSFGYIFTFPNACAIQTNLGANENSKKTVLENMIYLGATD